MPLVLNSKKHIAQKEHYCNFCGEKIMVGEKYIAQANIFEGQFYIWKTHIDCEWIAAELDMYDWCDDGVTQDDFIEGVNEAYYDLIGESEIDHNTFKERLNYVINIFKNKQL